MKQCPKCSLTYTDGTLNFCLDDGEWLVSISDGEPATAIQPRLKFGAPTEVLNNSEGSVQVGNRRYTAYKVMVPAALLLIAALCSAAYFYYQRSGARIRSLAVMPFTNETGDTDVDYLSDGMTESLINTLSQLPDLNVKARSSVFRYRGKDVTPSLAGRELNVEAVLVGSVSQRGQDLIFNVELVDPATENVLWTQTYHRRRTGLVTLHTDIARDVSRKLRAKLSGADEQRISRNYTEDSEAYQLYLRARFHAARRTPSEIRKAIEYNQQAISVDPGYALAFAGLAENYSLLADYAGAPAHEMVPKAKEAALKAISIADLGEAHATLCSMYSTYDYDFAGAERECLRAIELSPDSATAHHYYGLLLTRAGRHSESFSQFQKALELEPLSPIINRNYAEALFYARRYDESEAQYRKTIELDPNFSSAYLGLGSVLWVTGEFAECAEQYSRNWETAGQTEHAAMMRDAFAKEGWPGFLRLLLEQADHFRISANSRAQYLIALDRKDEAFEFLQTAHRNREYRMGHILVEPRLDPVRDDKRFGELLTKMGLSGQQRRAP